MKDWKRLKKSTHCQIQPVGDIPADFGGDLAGWILKHACRHQLRWLLAHLDDGVTWGEARADGLHLSGAAFPELSPALRPVTLQDLRLFGPAGELLLWRNGAGWQARLVLEGQQGDGLECFDEVHLLWGNTVEDEADGFLLLRHGGEGQRHAPPRPGEAARPPLGLLVRHFLKMDAHGQSYVAFSRLVEIVPAGEE